MQEILDILEQDALATPEKIGQLLKLPAEEVRRRVRQLEEDKVIVGYKTIIDDDKADRQLVKALIEVKITPERDGGFNHLAARIAKYAEVKTCYLMSGGYDLLVIVEGADLRQVATFVSEKLATISGVLSTATHFMLKAYKEQGTLYQLEQFEERLKVSP
ncbi:MAG: Lrp/AsnC family transcriptional regulator [Verrucomicrobiales bacterium]|jgi:DNA-binding Lrp family transcriptional regulator|nr:Lrp/AsnC family transcriptional regulator [Verrucomicrobiales bacterium]MDR1303690.1 Lrp/AsnC family transcriptional regulator [Verrucomicrobiales bacterium]